jgi:uncharacterized membrane-anchored protein
MGYSDSIKRYIGSSIILVIGLFLILSGLILGFIPESNTFKQQYGPIIALIILILGVAFLFYSRIYFINQKKVSNNKPKNPTDNALDN